MNNFAQDITLKSLLNDLENHFDGSQNLRMKALAYDADLLNYLLQNDSLKNKFFKVITANNFVFLKDEFLKFINLRLLSNSYTACANYIGLSFENKQEKFIKTDGDVVLNFPFKDGVIKGGQSKDEQKINEIFLNNIVAKDEIDVLFSPKVIKNFELVDKEKQQHSVEKIIEVLNKENPNLLIKGNNLIALHTLKFYLQQRKEKVKLIYIDPPYNTGNDSFNYNDKFNHSTWLCFMKNRLEVARELLSDDGVIFIQCDDNEQAYLKVLCDEIFGRENFVADFIRKTKSTTNDAKTGVNIQHENCLCFAKDKNNINLLGGQKNLSNYKNPDNDPNGSWINDNPSAKSGTKENGYFAVKNPYTGKIDYPPIGMFWRFSKNTIQKHIDEGRICFKKQHKENERGFIYKRYLKDLKTIQKTLDTLIFANNEFMNQVATKEAINLGFVEDFSYPKPESMAKIIIEHATNENDIVLDFFAGSGTTLAVAHKMQRRYIGIEQMDYIQNITKQRLVKVIDGEQGGISKSINWNGGGSFLYLELAELNAKFKQQIQQATTFNDLKMLGKELDKNAFLNYKIDEKTICQIIEEDKFKNLNFAQQQQMLIACLDANMDYIPFAEIDDENYHFSETDKQLNNAFYKISN